MKPCQCKKCKAGCLKMPGWFAPGEAEKAAEHMGMDFDEFKRRFLTIDYWVGGANVYRPVRPNIRADILEECAAGRMATYNSTSQHGICVFFKNGKCTIHPVKPYECKNTMGCDDSEKHIRGDINKQWEDAGFPLGKCEKKHEND